MGINPVPVIAWIFLVRSFTALITETEYGPGTPDGISILDIASTFVLGTVPGMPLFLNVFISVVTTTALVWAIAQLIRGV